MTIRFIRLVVFLLPLLALSSGVSLAASSSAAVPAGNSSHAPFCPADSGVAHQRTTHAYRVAQFGHCRCCGRDQNGHCNHQCCN